MKYNKLVRDKIPKIIKSKGAVPITPIALMFNLTETICFYKSFN